MTTTLKEAREEYREQVRRAKLEIGPAEAQCTGANVHGIRTLTSIIGGWIRLGERDLDKWRVSKCVTIALKILHARYELSLNLAGIQEHEARKQAEREWIDHLDF